MKRQAPRVVYVGRAACAAEAVPCSSCYALIGAPCTWNRHTGEIPHRARLDFAEALGLRDVATAPLLDQNPAASSPPRQTRPGAAAVAPGALSIADGAP